MSSNNPAIKMDEKEGHPVYVSQRELYLRYEIPVGEVYPFFQGLTEGKILASKCVTCGQLYFPPQAACPKCRQNKMDWVDISGQAQLVAYTQIFVRPQSFSEKQPYFVGVAKSRAGVNVLAGISVQDAKALKIGMPVKLAVERQANGVPTYIIEA